MDFGSITLLEICQSPNGGRIAHCLTHGEFLFVTSATPRYFRVSSADALFGKSLCDFVVPCDLEKLQDYIRAHSSNCALLNDVASKLTMMIHLIGSGQRLWVRLKTVPLSLRLLRCIDSVTVLASLKHHFADLKSFVVNDADLTTIFSLSTSTETTPRVPSDMDQEDDTVLSIAIPNSYAVPLELKNVSPCQWDDTIMATSPASPTRMLDSLDESLSSLAFGADWDAASTPLTFADLVSQ